MNNCVACLCIILTFVAEDSSWSAVCIAATVSLPSGSIALLYSLNVSLSIPLGIKKIYIYCMFFFLCPSDKIAIKYSISSTSHVLPLAYFIFFYLPLAVSTPGKCSVRPNHLNKLFSCCIKICHGSVEDHLFSPTFFFFFFKSYIPGTAVWGTFNFHFRFRPDLKSLKIWTSQGLSKVPESLSRLYTLYTCINAHKYMIQWELGDIIGVVNLKNETKNTF